MMTYFRQITTRGAGGGGGTPLYSLYEDAPLDRVWFLACLSSTGDTILCVRPKQGVTILSFVLSKDLKWRVLSYRG